MKDVFFKPWVGEMFDSGGIFGKKILALGEAHICGGCDRCGISFATQCDDMQTPNIVRSYIENYRGRWCATFRKFERALSGHETTDEESRKIWESIAFYNYIQVAMPEARMSPSDESWTISEEPFFEVLDALSPDLIVVWGTTRMYDNMPERNWRAPAPIVKDDISIRTGFYATGSGKDIRTIWIKHPSSAFSWDKWHEAIKNEIFDNNFNQSGNHE